MGHLVALARRVTWSAGEGGAAGGAAVTKCTCGYGGFHEPEKKDCDRNRFGERERDELLDDIEKALDASGLYPHAKPTWSTQELIADYLLKQGWTRG